MLKGMLALTHPVVHFYITAVRSEVNHKVNKIDFQEMFVLILCIIDCIMNSG